MKDIRENMATKEELAEVKTEMRDGFERVETDMENGFAELRDPK